MAMQPPVAVSWRYLADSWYGTTAAAVSIGAGWHGRVFSRMAGEFTQTDAG